METFGTVAAFFDVSLVRGCRRHSIGNSLAKGVRNMEPGRHPVKVRHAWVGKAWEVPTRLRYRSPSTVSKCVLKSSLVMCSTLLAMISNLNLDSERAFRVIETAATNAPSGLCESACFLNAEARYGGNSWAQGATDAPEHFSTSGAGVSSSFPERSCGYGIRYPSRPARLIFQRFFKVGVIFRDGALSA